jgi:hypothetical protein
MVALLSLRVKTKPKCNKNATATQAKKETTVVVYATTVLGTFIFLKFELKTNSPVEKFIIFVKESEGGRE